MRVILEAIAGPHANKRIVMPGYQKGTFGRTEWADYPFPDDPLMSSQHFSIECVGTTCVLRDLGSTNGTFVDGERVVESTLVSGSIIRAGHTRVKVTLDEGPAPARASNAPAVKAPPPNKVATEPDLRPIPPAPRPLERPGPRADKPRVPPKTPPSAHLKALDDEDPVVRRNALLAAAWTGRRWVLDHCRKVCTSPSPANFETCLLLAILGDEDDLARMLAIGRVAELGPKRFQILGAFGHPEVVGDLLVGIESDDPLVAVTAARAFTKMTGVDVSSEAQAAPASTGEPADQSDPGMSGIALPSAAKAARAWQRLKSKFSASPRWLGGLDAGSGLSPEAADTLDLESRFEACLRGRFQGTWQASSFDREQFADKLAANEE